MSRIKWVRSFVDLFFYRIPPLLFSFEAVVDDLRSYLPTALDPTGIILRFESWLMPLWSAQGGACFVLADSPQIRLVVAV